MSLSDRITVIRKGKVVFNCDICDTKRKKKLATQMVGRQVESIVTKAEDPHGPVVLELKKCASAQARPGDCQHPGTCRRDLRYCRCRWKRPAGTGRNDRWKTERQKKELFP